MFGPLIIFSIGLAHGWQVRTNDAGHELSWKKNTVSYSINPAGTHGMSEAAVESMVAAATRNWASPVGDQLVFKQSDSTSIVGPDSADNVNAIYFDERWTHDPALLGLTFVWSTTSGEIVGFDMALNATHHDWSVDGADDKNDLLNTLSHEFGHALGVDHSPAVETATMYPSSFPGEIIKRDLDVDDIDALLYLYADAENTEAASNTGAGCSTIPRSLDQTWGLAMLICALAGFRRRIG